MTAHPSSHPQADAAPHAPAHPPSHPQLSVCVVGTGGLADQALDDLRSRLAGIADCRSLPNPADAVAWALADQPVVPVSLIVLDADDHVDGQLAVLTQAPALARSRKLVVTERSVLTAAWSSEQGHLDGVVTAPWPVGLLADYVRAEISRWWHVHGATSADLAPVAPRTPRSDLLSQLRQPVHAATADLLRELESVLGPRTRLRVPAGVRITRQDEDIDKLFLVLRGEVMLTMHSRTGKLVMHQASTGPLVGLLALAEQRRSSVTARTATDCELVQLTLEQLDEALAANPRVGQTMTVLSIRAFAARLRRAQNLHREKADLAGELRQALTELEEARAELVDQARLATLGELSAGIAHELNNPIAALDRSAEHLAEQLPRLLAGTPHAEQALDALTAAQSPTGTDLKQVRAARRAVAGAVGDAALARRLVAAGVTDPERAQALAAGPPQRLAAVEAAAGVGSALHALTVASNHVTSLVQTLRRTARPDAPDAEPIELAGTLADSLQLMGARLAGITVTVQDEAPGVLVAAHPGRLTQVWNNLLSNAADAVGEGGTITVTVRSTEETPAGRGVEVRVHDDGPGVPESLQEEIFRPRFTTKHGVVRFGLGLGLGIAKSIVTDLAGQIRVESRPGDTTFTVTLPVAGHLSEPAPTSSRESSQSQMPSSSQERSSLP